MRITYHNKIPSFIQATLLVSLLLLVQASASGNIILRMQTDLGSLDIEMFDSTPLTRDNFLNYVNRGDYDGTFFHRNGVVNPGDPDSEVFVVQGGGYVFDGLEGNFFTDPPVPIPLDPPVPNEPGISNTIGTIAMAKKDGLPDSATSQFFINRLNNLFLDLQNEGFTVFAQVLGDGMDVVDAIAELQRCGVLVPFLCGIFSETPFAIFDTPDFSTNNILVNINYIGLDDEGDGVIDKLEDAAPNDGDGNNDGVIDSLQQHVSSFPWSTGEYAVVESSGEDPHHSLSILGDTFVLANPPADLAFFDGIDVSYGFAGYDLPDPADGEPVTLTITLPEGAEANLFFNFGPTLDDPTPHWYEFFYDGETGAKFDNNVVTLYFVDGKRGDDDLDDSNGSISTLGGPAFAFDADADNIPNTMEDGAPNFGDGNNDNIRDSKQAHVSSLLDVFGSYITVETVPDTLSLFSLNAGFGLEFLFDESAVGLVNGRNFPHGFIEFGVAGLDVGAAFEVKVILPENERPVSYLKYGPTLENPLFHVYEFLYDEVTKTGAEFDANVITLHFVDGMRGDADLQANGVVIDPGAPAVSAPPGSSSGGGSSGCSLGAPGSGAWQGGAWWLLLSMLTLYRLRTLMIRRALDNRASRHTT